MFQAQRGVKFAGNKGVRSIGWGCLSSSTTLVERPGLTIAKTWVGRFGSVPSVFTTRDLGARLNMSLSKERVCPPALLGTFKENPRHLTRKLEKPARARGRLFLVRPSSRGLRETRRSS